MTEAQFFSKLTGDESDLQRAVNALQATKQPFCLIGGLAVNHYVDPVVTLDADFAVAASQGVEEALAANGFVVEIHPHSINANLPGSRLRIQIAVNSCYGGFPQHAVQAVVFGVHLPVAALDDLVQGKLWAMQDDRRLASKRLKDRADIVRICETHQNIISMIPLGLIAEVDAMRTKDGDGR